jgi:type I restriction enzyme M protein
MAEANEAPATGAKQKKEREKKLAALARDKERLQKKLDGLDAALAAIGGVITPEDAKRLILKKLYDLVSSELTRYLNTEKRALIGAFEKLWDKYAVSFQLLEQKRHTTIHELNGFLTQLAYLR